MSPRKRKAAAVDNKKQSPQKGDLLILLQVEKAMVWTPQWVGLIQSFKNKVLLPFEVDTLLYLRDV